MGLKTFACGLAALMLCLPVQAETKKPEPFPDFSAKFVKPPKKASGKRITVQVGAVSPSTTVRVTPNSTVVALAKPKAKSGKAHEAWFWDKISPHKASASPARLETALTHLSVSGKSGPRLQVLQDIAAQYGSELMRASIGTKVSPAFALAVISVESGGNARAESRVGAQGLMQLMPVTADRFEVADAFDPLQNITGGVKFLDHLMTRFDSDPMLVLAGYNAGEGAVRDHDGVPPYAETRAYVPKVLAAWRVARGLCLTPPTLLSDGCVFALKGLSQ